MNKQECDILEALHAEPYINQRVLSDLSGHSLGIVNRSLRQLLKEGYIDDNIRLTKKAENEFADKAPKQAIILARALVCVWCRLTLSHRRLFYR